MASNSNDKRAQQQSSRVVVALLQKLISTYLRDNNDDDKVIGVSSNVLEARRTSSLQYCLRILGSRIGSASTGGGRRLQDEAHAVEFITKKLSAQNRAADALRFADLATKLSSTRTLSNRWATLSLLQCLAGSGSDTSSAQKQRGGNNPLLFSQGLVSIEGELESFRFAAAQARQAAADHAVRREAHEASVTRKLCLPSDSSAPPTSSSPSSFSSFPFSSSSSHSARSSSSSSPVAAGSSPSACTSQAGRNAPPPSGPPREVPESRLVRECVYALQGIDGTLIRYFQATPSATSPSSSSSSTTTSSSTHARRAGYAIIDDAVVSPPVREIVAKICKLGSLYRNVKLRTSHLLEGNKTEAMGSVKGGAGNDVEGHAPHSSFGLVSQAFFAAVERELREYYALIAVLQTQVERSTPDVCCDHYYYEHTHPEQQGGGGRGGVPPPPSMTLLRLFVWVQEPLKRMRLLALLIKKCTAADMPGGGALASTLHHHLNHGDDSVRDLVGRLLRQVSRPILDMIKQWVFEGELRDPFHEFFISADQTVDDRRMWHDMYSMREEMRPTFISPELARRALLTGKTINFMRRCCCDSISWAAETSGLARKASQLDYCRIEELESVVDDTAAVVSKRALGLLDSKYKIVEHCRALKQYLLLGHGDFVQYLMTLVHTELDKPATAIYRHNLSGILESAIRGSNAQYDTPDTVNRLEARLLTQEEMRQLDVVDGEENGGGVGWDMFILDYIVDAPIDTVLTREAMAKYLRIFRFLWAMKRAEHSLSQAWLSRSCSNLRWNRNRGKKSDTDGTDLASSERWELLHRCDVMRTHMNHFVRNLQYYVMFDVIASSWDGFEAQVRNATDLDCILRAHTTHLDDIVNNSLLGNAHVTRSLLSKLKQLLAIAVRFKHLQDSLVSTFTSDSSANAADPTAQLSRVRTTLQHLSDQYFPLFTDLRRSLSSLLEGTAAFSVKVNPEIIKSLLTRLDYNHYYERRERSDQSTTTTAATSL